MGIDFVIRVLSDLEIEIVMFNESRQKNEVQMNTNIKDAMRATDTISDILKFLCHFSVDSSTHLDLKVRCLRSISELIGWIDINLILSEVLNSIYSILRNNPHEPYSLLKTASIYCLYELIKKGMDPVVKINLIKSINLIHFISLVTICPYSDDPETIKFVYNFGLLLDILVVEFLGCWSKYEDLILKRIKDNNDSVNENSQELFAVIPFLIESMPIILSSFFAIFNFQTNDCSSENLSQTIFSAIYPGCGKLINILKHQNQYREQILEMVNNPSIPENQRLFFLAEDYLNILLMGIFKQSQYPLFFDFDSLDDDDINDVVEVNIFPSTLFFIIIFDSYYCSFCDWAMSML